MTQRILALMLVILLAVTAACGDDDDDDGDDDGAAPTATTATGAEPTEPEGDGEGDATAGEAVAQANCVSCHSIDGSTIVGPTWQGLYNSEVELEGGETVTADEEYIRESIVDPGAKVHAGFADGIMPSFEGTLSEEQINDVIAYIKTLE